MIHKIKGFIERYKKVYTELLLNDFKTRYNGSFLGMIWGFIFPIITMLIYWIVFQYGLRSGDRPDGVPYVIFMIAGAVPWFLFSDIWGGVTSCFIDYSYLVKKLNFEVKLLPLVKMGSALIIHVVFLNVCTMILNFAGYYASWYYLQVIYYLFATLVFSLLIGLITSSLAVYIRDVIQIVGVILQIGFWANPICWGQEMLNGVFGMILKLNPLFYCIEGYRDSILYRRGFWEYPLYTIYFWVCMVLLFFLARYIYKKMRPRFADVL